MEETRPSRGKHILALIGHIAKSSVVLIVALAAAGITCFFVPVDKEYLEYYDLETLACLFCTLAVVAAFKNIKFFVWLADIIVRRFKNMRNIVLALVFVTYFGSMIMANDMALITFLPLGYFVLDSCGNKKLTAFTFIMQNIAANLGGMLTPFGNPQNLYLYSYFEIPTGEFFQIMALPFAAAFVMILGICLFVKPEAAAVQSRPKNAPPAWRIAVYSLLFVLSVLIVFRVFPYYWGLLAVVAALLIFDFRAILRVDYALLLTFCAFFVFSGEHGAHPRRGRVFGRAGGAGPAGVRHPFLPGHLQRALGGTAVKIHGRLRKPVGRRQHRRAGHPHRLAGEPHHPEYIPHRLPRRHQEVYPPLFRPQLRFFGGAAGDRIPERVSLVKAAPSSCRRGKIFFSLKKLDFATQKAPSAEGAFCRSMPRILLRKLRVIQVIIEAAAGHEALVRALLDDGAFIHHQNEVGV